MVPLFRAEATRIMQQWPQQTPLHGRDMSSGGLQDIENIFWIVDIRPDFWQKLGGRFVKLWEIINMR